MPEQSNDQPDYQAELEQHEFVKAQGIEAWSQAIADMLPHCDDDKRILIAEGMKAVLQGPPSFRMPNLPNLPAIDAEFVQPPSHIFEQTLPDGTIICWDWFCLASRGTHASKSPSGIVSIWKGREMIIELNGEAAEKFWEWKACAIKFYPAPPMMRRPA